MPGTSPLFKKLTFQLVPAVLLTAVGVLALGHLSRPASVPPVAAPIETAVRAEAVFTSTPRPAAEEPKSTTAARPVSKPKPVATNTAVPRKPEVSLKPEPTPVHQATVGAPLQIVPPAEQMQAATPVDTSVMGKLRSVGATVQQMPQRTYSKVASWFTSDAPAPYDAPPRPPADIPQNFKTAM